MKGSRTIGAPPEGSPESMDLSLVGLPPPVSQRPSSASATKSIVRSVSVVTGSEPRKRALVSVGTRALLGWHLVSGSSQEHLCHIHGADPHPHPLSSGPVFPTLLPLGSLSRWTTGRVTDGQELGLWGQLPFLPQPVPVGHGSGCPSEIHEVTMSGQAGLLPPKAAVC